MLLLLLLLFFGRCCCCSVVVVVRLLLLCTKLLTTCSWPQTAAVSDLDSLDWNRKKGFSYAICSLVALVPLLLQWTPLGNNHWHNTIHSDSLFHFACLVSFCSIHLYLSANKHKSSCVFMWLSECLRVWVSDCVFVVTQPWTTTTTITTTNTLM